MEISHSLSCRLLHDNLPCSAPILPSRVPSIPRSIVPSWSGSSRSFSKLGEVKFAVKRQRGITGPSYASGIRASSADIGERWLLEPVGDGDSRHIGFKVEMPGAFEIASNAVTVGRLPEKADMVIPVATVSGLHARIQKKGEYLVVMDLDSTNGTFINEKRLRPGVASVAPPGSRIIFGDIHLAMYLVSKLENMEPPTDAEESQEQPEEGSSTETSDAVIAS
ncbi:hypothetical protein MLD38_004124 [Melastoma candidum]|uniref:Uncharacterized protein n=1 Tax=Melastoma candidum TaxID=119954 RepID=A0ACB9S7X4_9MYRT|nr:hypothetical protein MLD38_004124 [Melastoma candidum]